MSGKFYGSWDNVHQGCNTLGLPVFLEPLPVENVNGSYLVKLNASDLIRTVGVASGLGDSSAGLWLKIPYVDNFVTVARATTLPILMLGGESTGNQLKFREEFGRGMGSGTNICGALVGRNVLYPGQDDPLAVAFAVRKIVDDSVSVTEAVKELAARRGMATDLTAIIDKFNKVQGTTGAIIVERVE